MLKSVFQDITNVSSKRIRLTVHKSVHRRKLLKWIYEVCGDFRYSAYTFTATVIIIDRYTEKNGFELDEYQLIGISALFLAAKIEESKTHPASEYASVTENAFSIEEILAKEWSILKSLDTELYIKLPQFHFNPDHFNSLNILLTLSQKRDLLNSFIAAQLETRSYSRNSLLLYLESKREMEGVLSSKELPETVKFYIENNILDVLKCNN
ncbi:G2/mitotic-specific cyclin [Glugoides intestinalis]